MSPLMSPPPPPINALSPALVPPPAPPCLKGIGKTLLTLCESKFKAVVQAIINGPGASTSFQDS